MQPFGFNFNRSCPPPFAPPVRFSLRWPYALTCLTLLYLLTACAPLRPPQPALADGQSTATVAPAEVSSGGEITGKVTWLIGSEHIPLPAATVELHEITKAGVRFLTSATTDQQGEFVFKTVKDGQYMLPIVTWGSHASEDICPRGTPWQVLGGWIDANADDSGLQSLVVNGRAMEEKGITAAVAKARQAGLSWVALLLHGGEFTLSDGKSIQQNLQFECR